MNRTVERRLAEIEADVEALARQLLPRPSDPDDPMTLLRHLTCEEFCRLETTYRSAAAGELDGDQAGAAWDDAKRRAMSRMLMGADIEALEDREREGRVLVRIPLDEPPLPGRTRLVGYVPDQAHPGVWHVEAVYRGVLPRTMTTAELARHDPVPWPPR